MEQAASSQQLKLDCFLVCGLGSLGQHCVAALKEFGVSVIAIEQRVPENWEISNLSDLLDELIIGDCRQKKVLEQAQIEQCRAVVIVTSNERVNTETALIARQLNPQTRLVVRSAQKNLNRLLSQRLGNFVAYEATQLPAPAFALAALGCETLGFFQLDGKWLRVVTRQMQAGDPWCNRRQIWELNNRSCRVLTHLTPSMEMPKVFRRWDQETIILPGDTIVCIEITDPLFSQLPATPIEIPQHWWQFWQEQFKSLSWDKFQQKLIEFWYDSHRNQVQRVAIVCTITVIFLLVCGTVLFNWQYPEVTLPEAFHTTAILLLGGYADLFGEFPAQVTLPWWLQLFSLGLTLAGTALVGVLYALLTQALLSTRFQFLQQRPPVPSQDHIILVGLGRVGQRVATILQEFQQPLVALTRRELEPNLLPQLPVIGGNFTEALKKANVATAKSLLIATDDEILNLEIGLMANNANPKVGLVIRTFEQRLSENLKQMLPEAQVLCAYGLAAEAFAGAAFGEHIRSLFRLNNQTILVTEYKIEAGDTLNGLLLAEVACGYGVVPILHQQPHQDAKLMPSDDIKLVVGDRMVVLATINGLQRIEGGKIYIQPKQWRVQVEKALTQDAVFEGANAIARISGCTLQQARKLMKNLPGTLPTPLYRQQAQRLVRQLSKRQVLAFLVEISHPQ
ncbi:MAG: potassium transporter TrkA [Symploca sp. SIO2B6]|nr:potassium transporter TrkA [Symploca sp. SIO2B6]